MCNRNYTIQEQKLMAKIKSSRKHVCEYCGNPIADKTKLTIDHILPFSRGGLTIESNLVISCEQCNKEKSDMTKEEYMKYIELKELVTTNNIANIQLKETQKSYENLINGFEEIMKRKASLLREKKELEDIMKNSKVNAAEGYMLFSDFRKLLQELSEAEIQIKGLSGANGFAINQLKQVKNTLEALNKNIMTPIRNELGIGSLSERQNNIIKEIEKYILKYNTVNEEQHNKIINNDKELIL